MRSDQNTAKIPSKTFSAFLPIIRQDLIDAGLEDPTILGVARGICDFNNLNKEVTINDDTYHAGWTREVAYSEIAEATFFSRRTVISAINTMIEAKVLEKDQHTPRTRNRFRFLAYDKLHAQIEADPSMVQETHAYRFDPASTSATDAQPSATDTHSLELKEFKGPHPTGSSDSTGLEDPEEGGDFKSSQKQKNNADSSLSENSSSPKPQPVSQQPKQAQPSQNPDLKVSPPPAVPSDVVPNSQIGKLLDNLTASTSMNAAPTDDNIEDFVRLLKPDQAVISYPEVQKAVPLHQRITKLLADAAIEMPPLLFFKHCLKHTDALIADGKLDARPTSPNFFMKGHTGPQVLEHTINQLRGENRAHTDKQRTDKYLSELKSKRGVPMPPELKAKLFGKQ